MRPVAPPLMKWDQSWQLTWSVSSRMNSSDDLESGTVEVRLKEGNILDWFLRFWISVVYGGKHGMSEQSSQNLQFQNWSVGSKVLKTFVKCKPQNYETRTASVHKL